MAALSVEPAQAKIIGRLYAEKKIDRALLPQVAAALQKHVAADKTGEFQKMLAEVYKGGLIVGSDEASLKQLEEMVKAKGDATRGRAVFLDSAKSQCAVCHQLEGVGGRGMGASSPHAGTGASAGGGIGPDLTKIGTALATNKLIESIIEPSKEIKEGFGTWVLTTNDGQVYTGLKIAENDKAVIIRDPSQAEDILIPRGDVKELRPGQKSAMPDNVVSQLSAAELIDLVAFLKDEKAQASLRGMVSRAWVVGPFAGDAMKKEEWEPRADPLKPIKAAAGPADKAGKDLQWKRADVGGNGTIDLKLVAGKGGPGSATGAAYVLVYAASPKDQKVTVRMTGEGGIRAMVNGSPQVAGALSAAGATGTLSLTAGWNTLLVRVEPTDKGAIALGVQVTGGEGVRFALRPE